MGDPYRESGGVACPRCNVTMSPQDDGGFACRSGCGTWIVNKMVERLLGTVDLAKRGVTAPYFKVQLLPATACLVCAKQLEPIYRVAGDDYLTMGQCTQHGIWCERAGHADFELAFEKEIVRYGAEAKTTKPRTVAQIADELGNNPVEMAWKIIQLESQIERLTARLESLERQRLR